MKCVRLAKSQFVAHAERNFAPQISPHLRMTQHHDPPHWQTLSSRYVYDKKPYMTLREDHVRMTSGAEIEDFFVFEYPDWASVLAVTEAGAFVLIRQYRHGIGQVHFELPAGVVDPGEPLLASAQRELLEETGFGGGHWQLWLAASPNPSTHTNTCHIFLATGVQKLREQHLDATEEIAVRLLSPADVLHALQNGGVFQALHAAAIWKYFALNGLPG